MEKQEDRSEEKKQAIIRFFNCVSPRAVPIFLAQWEKTEIQLQEAEQKAEKIPSQAAK